MTASLLIVGDSIALGATEVVGTEIVSRAPESFVDLLRASEPGRTIDCDAAVRRTTRDAVAVLPDLLRRHRPALVMLALGGNDADIDWKRYIVSGGQRIRHNVPVEQFESNLRAFVDAARDGGAVPLLSDLPDGDLAGRGRWLTAQSNGQFDVSAMIDASGGEAESDRRLATYREAVERVADERHVPVVRWGAALATLPIIDRYGPDALHPGDGAHATIARVIGESLAQLSAPIGPGAAARG